ncbi:MAG TPA: universal stress protein [Nitrospirota bacterium]|nr:universal stress protein [Nitrospirota bacterium]
MNRVQSCPVSKLDKILVATDRSMFSEGALTAAITFAKHCSSKLYVMTVVEKNPEYETAGAELLQKETEEAARYLASLKVRALEEIPSCETILRRGDSASRLIVEEAVQKEIDMIAVGRRGRSGLEKVLLGSAAAKVIGHAPCKVLVVPRAARIGYKNILVATDGSEHANTAGTDAIEVAKRTGSRLMVISVVPSEDQKGKARANVGDIALAAQQAGVHAEKIALAGKPHEVIVETAKSMGVDLIVMGAYGKTGLRRLLMGSTTEKVIGLAPCAILVAKRAS